MFEIQQQRAAGGKSKRKRELKEDLSMAVRSNEAVEVVPTLEPLPKWERVKEVLEVCLAAQKVLKIDFASMSGESQLGEHFWHSLRTALSVNMGDKLEPCLIATGMAFAEVAHSSSLQAFMASDVFECHAGSAE